MSRRLLVFFFILVLGFAGFMAFRWWGKRLEPNALVYNPLTEQFEPTVLDDRLDRSAIRQENLHNNPDGLRNYTIMKGYFHRYDADSQMLHIKAQMAYTQGEVFELIALELPPTATLTCVPATFTDRNTGKTIPSQELTVPVHSGATLTMPFEQALSFTELIDQSTDQTFFFIQLTDTFKEQGSNAISKLIAVGVCE